MAATRLIMGVIREFWQELVPQGPGPVAVPTDIRITAGQLCRVQGLLTIVTPTGSPVFTAVPSIVNKRLVITVKNWSAGGNLATWTLDVRLMASSDQGSQGATSKSLGTQGYIQVANGATSGLAGTQTLAATYAIGADPGGADQRMIVQTAKGGGVTIDCTDAGVAANSVSLEVRQSAAWSLPTVISRRGNDALGPVIQFDKARGTYPIPADVQAADVLGSIDFIGQTNNVDALSARISALCTADGGGADKDFALEAYATVAGAMARVLRIGAAADGLFAIAYGADPIIEPSLNSTGQLGEAGAQWASIHVDTANVYANVCLGGVTPGANAHHTVVLPETNTVAPAASVGLVHLYGALSQGTDACAPVAGTALAISQECVTIPLPASVGAYGVPVKVNGLGLLLLAVEQPPPPGV
jgi:hypothetical protein